MTDVAERTTTTAGWARRRVPVRMTLWVLVVVSALFALWGTPRSASQDDFARALKSGDVRAVSLSGNERYGLEAGPSGITTAQSSTNVLWEDSAGRVHRTDLRSLSVGDPGSPGDGTDVPATIAATARDSGRPAALFERGLGPAQYSAVPLGVLTLCALGLLVLGRQPRRVTKWGMFWLLGIPFGVGLLWWLARDAPFSRPLSAAEQPLPRARGPMPYGVRRAGGGTTVLVALGVAVAVALAVAFVLGLGATTNGLSSPTEPWHLVLLVAPPTS